MKALAIIAAVVIVLLMVTGPSEPRFWNAAPSIEGSILEDLPMGSSMEATRTYLKERSYEIHEDSPTLGIINRDRNPVGSARIQATLDEYWFTTTSIQLKLAFDSELKLIALEVDKEVDLL